MISSSFLRSPAATLVCLAFAAGCNPSNNTEVARAKADADAARAEAHAVMAELAKAKAGADAAREEAAAAKSELESFNASEQGDATKPPPHGNAPAVTATIADSPPAKPTKTLRQAVLDNDVAQVKAHLSWKTDANVGEGDDGETPLACAAYFAHHELAELLIASGANVNIADKHGRTPLHNVFIGIPTRGSITENAEDRVAVLKLLLAKGADVNARDTYAPTPELKGGDTPLHLAVVFRAGGLIDPLLEAGADVNLKNNNGETPLTLATEAIAKKLRSRAKVKEH